MTSSTSSGMNAGAFDATESEFGRKGDFDAAGDAARRSGSEQGQAQTW